MEKVILNNKLECPVIGIGTFMLSPAEAENSVREALKMGYSLIDTANAYVNERACGRGMQGSGIRREAIFLSTKIWPSEYENENAVDETLKPILFRACPFRNLCPIHLTLTTQPLQRPLPEQLPS